MAMAEAQLAARYSHAFTVDNVCMRALALLG